jgi:energy-coupling factor transporter ATP-binding protein EcfA2
VGPVLIFGAGALGYIHAGEVVSFYTFFSQFISPLTAFSNALVSIQGMLIAAERIFNIMDIEASLPEKAEAVEAKNLKGHIIFENVEFSYLPKNAEAWRVKNINLEIMPGEKVAFVGGSGSGKSTIINLVARFYDATHGRVLIDGHDVRDFQLKSLRQSIGMVAQNATLFHGTVEENIRFGKPRASAEELHTAAEIGSVTEFLDKLEKGYDTELGELGQGLSGGQKQRLAIARAALINPAIYIFDEATSALDAETERTVTHALDKTSRGRTTLVIAHRLNTILNSDKIVFMGTDENKHGLIKAVGTHEELLKTCEEYAVMYGMKSRRKTILMPISPLYNTLPLLPTVVGLARSFNAHVYVLDLGALEQNDLIENRFGFDLETLNLDVERVAQLNFAHTQRVQGITNLMEGENVKCEIVRPTARINWVELLIQTIDTVEATHVVVMDHFLVPFEQIQATVRNVSRKMDVEIILVDPTVGMKNVYDFGTPQDLTNLPTTVAPPPMRWRTTLIAILPIVWLALVLLLGYPALLNVGMSSMIALSIVATISALGYIVGLLAMKRT